MKSDFTDICQTCGSEFDPRLSGGGCYSVKPTSSQVDLCGECLTEFMDTCTDVERKEIEETPDLVSAELYAKMAAWVEAQKGENKQQIELRRLARLIGQEEEVVCDADLETVIVNHLVSLAGFMDGTSLTDNFFELYCKAERVYRARNPEGKQFVVR